MRIAGRLQASMAALLLAGTSLDSACGKALRLGSDSSVDGWPSAERAESPVAEATPPSDAGVDLPATDATADATVFDIPAGTHDRGADCDAAEVGDVPTGEAGPAPSRFVLRLSNAGSQDILFNSAMCGFDIELHRPGDPQAHPIWTSDHWCDCNACRADGRRSCDFVEPLCDEPLDHLRPGAHWDLDWNGNFTVFNAPPPPGSSCSMPCDHWEVVQPGSYLFTVVGAVDHFDLHVDLPDTGGIIELPLKP